MAALRAAWPDCSIPCCTPASAAWKAGRITLNPIKHIDLVGTVIVPAVILLLSSGGLLFGWAKPVPVNFGQLRKPKQDMLWVVGGEQPRAIDAGAGA